MKQLESIAARKQVAYEIHSRDTYKERWGIGRHGRVVDPLDVVPHYTHDTNTQILFEIVWNGTLRNKKKAPEKEIDSHKKAIQFSVVFSVQLWIAFVWIFCFFIEIRMHVMCADAENCHEIVTWPLLFSTSSIGLCRHFYAWYDSIEQFR